MRAHVPAQVAAVLEDLAAGAALVHPPVLPQLPHQLPPDAVPGGENQTPLEGDAAALMMREPARWKVNRKAGGRLSSRGGERAQGYSHLGRGLSKSSQLDGRKGPSSASPRARGTRRRPGTHLTAFASGHQECHTQRALQLEQPGPCSFPPGYGLYCLIFSLILIFKISSAVFLTVSMETLRALR